MDTKDAARLKMRADANFERNIRYKDSRLRTIGLPTQALAQQVAERKFAKQREIEEGKAERARNAEIDQILEDVAREEEGLRRSKAAMMRSEWDAQVQEKNFLKKQARQNEIDSFKNDTPMIFAGDDPLHDERVAMQRDQIRQWTQEDREEKEYRRRQEYEEDMNQAQLNLAIDEMRLQQQEEEDRLKKEVTRKILSENNELGIIKNQLQAEADRLNDLDRNCTLILAADAVTDEFGNVSNKDCFRGYTKGQQKQLLMENEELIRLKAERDEQARLEDEQWYRESLRLQRVMAEVELENEQVRSAYHEDVQAHLRSQVAGVNVKNRMQHDEDHGKISGDFYSKFGTSCR